jgi:uncharacterized protein (TIGR03000 family)
MYTIVLATMLTTGTAAPDWGCRGCYGCCGGCWGCCGGCWGCCGGCWGCCGGGCWGCCGGCYGCYGCYGGWGGFAPYGWGSGYPYYPYSGWGIGFYGSCYGCWGTCFGCHGCYGCYGCVGCYGGVALAAPVMAAPALGAPATVVPAAPVLPAQPRKEEEQKKSTSLGNAAEVIVKAPADVQLSVEDRDIPRTAGEQAFHTPALEPGYSYTYTFKARVVRDGKTVAYTKQVKVQAGQTSTADFTKLAAEGKDSARIVVKLPAEARLYVDNVLCPLTSATRSFTTPELDAGQKYYYTLKAEVVRGGETRTVRKRVIVEAGKEVMVEFNELPLQTVSR